MAAGNARGAGGTPTHHLPLHPTASRMPTVGQPGRRVPCCPSPVPKPSSCLAVTNPGGQRTVTPSCRYMGYVRVTGLFLPIWECVFPAGSSASLRCTLPPDPSTSPPRFLFSAFHVITPVLTQQFPAAAFNGLVSRLLPKPGSSHALPWERSWTAAFAHFG